MDVQNLNVARRMAARRSRTLTGAVTPATPEADRFDPAKASVAAVLAHVEDHPDDREAILAAEMSGKARKGIVGPLSDD